ncbi:hypothetical protein [Nitrosophilus alvini]|uniref:hypothetical protein n=1 Tax=Nitrosophilus alvini TaxID=2714855 RepID=UPI00190AD1B3|nr:hypothetical protein [Nitrosophilus alvini]
MSRKKIKILLSVLLFATALSSFFHHHDISEAKSDCTICILQHNIAADIPDSAQLPDFEPAKENIQTPLVSFYVSSIPSSRFSRAPPKIS